MLAVMAVSTRAFENNKLEEKVMKTVSVIVPVFNTEKYLNCCIQSIVNQTYKALEIILVNDGSTDKSLSICEDYALKDERVKVINKIGGGVSSARNAGLNIASGELVCFFDSDDWVEADFIEKLCVRLGDNDICIGGYISDTYDENESLIKTRNVLLNIDYIDDQFPLDDYSKLFALSMSLYNKVYNLKLIQENNLRFDERVSFGEDGLFNTDFFLLTQKICFLHYAGYHYIRRKKESLSTKFYEDFLGIKFRALKRRCELLLYWGLNEEKINRFKYDSYFNIVWSEIGNIKRKKYSMKERRRKIGNIVKNQEIIAEVKKYKPKGIKNKIKKMVFLIKSKTWLY